MFGPKVEKEEEGKLEKNLKPGDRILFQAGYDRTIHNRVVQEVSPSGKLFRVGDVWYTRETSLDPHGALHAEILEVFPGSWIEVIPKGKEDEGKEDEGKEDLATE